MQFPLALDVASITQDSSADANIRAVICAAIWTAVETPGTVTTSSLDCTSLTVEQLLRIISELRSQSFGVTSASAGHITITWPSAA